MKNLIYDLEVSPLRIRSFGVYNTNALEIEQHSYIYCFSYRWSGKKKIHSVSLKDYPARYKADPTDDYDVVKRLWELRNEADITTAHNNDRFDKRVANTRFLYHKLGPPAPSFSIDTLKVARKHFKLPSNSLDSVCQFLGIGAKTSKKYGDLWRGVEAGNKADWNDMIRYCEQDVQILEDLYLMLRPYITNHPHPALFGGRPDVCDKCGSPRLHNRGVQPTKTLIYQRYQCQDCGGWGRFLKSDKDFEKPEIVSISQT